MFKFKRCTEQFIVWSDELLEREDFILVLGKSKNENLVFNLNDYQHILIGGVAGCGKTELVKTIAWQARKKEAKVFIINTSFLKIFDEEMQNEIEVLENDILILNLFRKLKKESFKRLQAIRNNKTNINELPKILIFIDDVSHYLHYVKTKDTRNNCEMDLKTKIIIELKKLLIETKNSGIHFILSSTNLYMETLGYDILNLMSLRIVGTVYDSFILKRIFTEVDSEQLPTHMDKGVFLTFIDDTVLEFKNYIIK